MTTVTNSILHNFTPEERENFKAADLVGQECCKAQEKSLKNNHYLEPYYEMKCAAIALAREVIKFRAIQAESKVEGGAQ